MDYLGKDYLKERIEKYQKFLLFLLHIHIGKYYPLRKWLGISYKGKIDEISHLSFGYNTKYFRKGKQWYKQQTRVYQQPDLGYKLNLVLERIPQLSFALPALLKPAVGLGALMFFFLTQTTYQPSIKDSFIKSGKPDTNYNYLDTLYVETRYVQESLVHFDISDIPDGASFSQGDLLLYDEHQSGGLSAAANRLTQINWTEDGVTYNKYDGTNDWATAGGDYTTDNNVTSTCPGPDLWQTWSSSALIQDCYNYQSKNVHLIINSISGTGGYYAAYWSREYTDDTTLRPKLTVTYTVPTTYYQTLTATEVSSPTLTTIASFYRTLSVIESSIVTLTQKVTHYISLLVTEISQVSLIQKATHFITLITTETSEATLAAQQIMGRTLSVVENSVVSLTKLTKKVLSVVESSVASLLHSVSAYRMLSVVETSIPSLVKKMGRVLSVTETSVVNLLKVRYVELAVQEVSKVSLTLLKTFYRTLSVVSTGVVSLAKTMYKSLILPTVSTATVTLLTTRKRMLSVVESSVVTLQKQMWHAIHMTTTVIAKIWFFLNGRRVDDYRNKYSDTGGAYDDKYPDSGDKDKYTDKY